MGWYNETGPQGQYVVNSCVKFFRNMEGYPFPTTMDGQTGEEVYERFLPCVTDVLGEGHFEQVDPNTSPYWQIAYLSDRYQFLYQRGAAPFRRSIFCDFDDRHLISINEYDHLSAEYILAGFQLKKAFEKAKREVDLIGERIPFVHHKELGYLTANPKCVGSGMRAGVLMHLPSLTAFGDIPQITEFLKQRGISLQPFFSENKRSYGGLYQLSNINSLGISSEHIVQSVEGAAMYLIQREEEKQVQRFSRRPESLVDSIWRSFAVLSAARQLSLRELFVHISNIRLGAILKVLPIPLETVNELILRGQAGNVARYAYLFECVNENPDVLRARIIREELAPLLKQFL